MQVGKEWKPVKIQIGTGASAERERYKYRGVIITRDGREESEKNRSNKKCNFIIGTGV